MPPANQVAHSYPNQSWLLRIDWNLIATSLAILGLIASSLFFWQDWVVAKANLRVALDANRLASNAYRLALRDHRYNVWRDCNMLEASAGTEICNMYSCIPLDAVLSFDMDLDHEPEAVANYISIATYEQGKLLSTKQRRWQQYPSGPYAQANSTISRESCRYWTGQRMELFA